jgi:tocopherol cyclase
MIIDKLTAIFNPEVFQGKGKKHTYFEGWYFKVVNASETKAYAFIPGIALDGTGNRQAFIQVLDGKKRSSHYHKFDIRSFVAESNVFKIAVGDNHFSEDSINLNLSGLKGILHFKDNVRWPSHWYSPGIMGPYSFVPFMECYHGIVSMDHGVYGQLEMEDGLIDFNDGRGYIEKDWGRSFPSAYVWMQSNHFTTPGISLKVSVAKIPWVRKSFTGFIAGLWIRNRLIQFTTYNGSSLRKLDIDSKRIELLMANKKNCLEIIVLRDAATSLASPIRGFMDGRIEESMSSRMEVSLTDVKTGRVIFQDCGRSAAVEVAGSINEILHPFIYKRDWL